MKVKKSDLDNIPLFSKILGFALGGLIFAAFALGLLGLLGYVLPLIVAGFVIAAPIEAMTTLERGVRKFSAAHWLEGLRGLVF